MLLLGFGLQTFVRHLVPFMQDISPAPVPPKQPKRCIVGQGLFVSTVNVHADYIYIHRLYIIWMLFALLIMSIPSPDS